MIIRGGDVLAAAALLPLTEMTLSERFGTRHRAALGITEDTDAIAVVVSEESGQMSVVERARIVRVPTEAQLERALVALLEAPTAQAGLARGRRGTAARLRIARRRIRRDPTTGAPVPRRPPRPGPRAARRPATAAEAVEPSPEPVDPMPETPPEPPADGAEGDDDATHRVPEVPRDEAGGTAAAAVADR